MKTYVILFGLVGFLSCICGDNTECAGCVDIYKTCRIYEPGGYWRETTKEAIYKYRCKIGTKDGSYKYYKSLLSAGCRVRGQIKKSGLEWFDRSKCATVGCVQNFSTGTVSVQIKKPGCIRKTGIFSGKICYENGHTWEDHCEKFRCTENGKIKRVEFKNKPPFCT